MKLSHRFLAATCAIIICPSGAGAAGPLASGPTPIPQQLKRIDEYPDGRDFAPAHLRDHFASGRREDHLDREIAAVRRRYPAGGRGQGARRPAAGALGLDGGRRERGISVSSAVMSFEHEGLAFNLLDTPGHQDFREDTYRTLTAVDSAVKVLDAAKGIGEQTRKLFEVLPAARRADHHLCPLSTSSTARAATRSTSCTGSSSHCRSTCRRPPGRSAWGATFSAPTICSPMYSYCLSAAPDVRISSSSGIERS